jgi:hypothetical protein
MSARPFEQKFNEYLSKLIYAALADIEALCDEPKFTPKIYQNYENVCRTKENRIDGLTSRFVVSDAIRQHLSWLFTTMIEELKNADLKDTDTAAQIAEKASEANAECYTQFMHDVSTRHREHFGPTLKAASDPTKWFRAQLEGALPQYQNSVMITSRIYEGLDLFLKALAWITATWITYQKTALSGEFFLAVLATQGMNNDMITLIKSCLREKKPKAAKGASGKGGAKGGGKATKAAQAVKDDAAAATPATAAVTPDAETADGDDDLDDMLNGI